MKGFYPENFVIRLIICVVGMFAVWCLGKYVGATFIRHEPFVMSMSDYFIPVVMGIIESFVWKNPADR